MGLNNKLFPEYPFLAFREWQPFALGLAFAGTAFRRTRSAQGILVYLANDGSTTSNRARALPLYCGTLFRRPQLLKKNGSKRRNAVPAYAAPRKACRFVWRMMVNFRQFG